MSTAATPSLPVGILVAIALVGVLVVLSLVASRRRAQRGTNTTADVPQPPSPPVVWGLRVPGTPVQRMAKTVAVGFALFDPDERSEVVRSDDGGASWHPIPRDEWKDI